MLYGCWLYIVHILFDRWKVSCAETYVTVHCLNSKKTKSKRNSERETKCPGSAKFCQPINDHLSINVTQPYTIICLVTTRISVACETIENNYWFVLKLCAKIVWQRAIPHFKLDFPINHALTMPVEKPHRCARPQRNFSWPNWKIVLQVASKSFKNVSE